MFEIKNLVDLKDPAQQLVKAAVKARKQAHAPFSAFQVGAALLTREGRIVSGCNVESASYGLTMCAERVAVFKAISEGRRKFTHLSVVADTQTLTPPCGACRQVLWELAGDVEVILANISNHAAVLHMRDLLPHPFDADQFSE